MDCTSHPSKNPDSPSSGATVTDQDKFQSAKACHPKETKITEIIIQEPNIEVYREYMKEHVVICKFMGIWPSKRALKGWIQAKYNPRGAIELQLGSKGFFTVVFALLEDKDRIFEGGPYFFNSVGLYMRF